MLIQDTVNGSMEEVPDIALYQGDPTVYNGLGDPIGMLPGLPNPFDLIKNAVSTVSNVIRPMIPGLPIPAPPLPMPALPMPAIPTPTGMLPVAPAPLPGYPMPVPPGWAHPPSPYPGPHPRRMYLRCAYWRGQPGLVPQNPAPWPTPPVTPEPVATHHGGRHRGRHSRRYR